MQNLSIKIDWDSPIDESFPGGKNKEFDIQFAELETAALRTPEQQYGNTVIPAKEPDWQSVLGLAAALCEETKDVRVIALLARALTKIHGLSGLLYALDGLNRMMIHFWESMHPQLNIDSHFDPQVRFSAISNMAAPDGLLADMRASIVIHSKLAPLSFRDLERFHGTESIEINGIFINASQMGQIIEEVSTSEQSGALQIPQKILEILESIQDYFREKLGDDYIPDFKNITQPLQKISRLLLPQGTQSSETPDSLPLDHEANFMPSNSTPGAQNALREGYSRQDVVRQLEQVCRHLESHEPTSPAPMLIRRAIKLMDMNFMEVLQEMAPEGLTQASFVTGVEVSR